MLPVPPPRPPLPHESQLDTPSGSSYLPGGGGGGMGGGGMASSSAAGGGYPETTDDESEDLFHYAPTPSQGPIMVRQNVSSLLMFMVPLLNASLHLQSRDSLPREKVFVRGCENWVVSLA